MITENSEDLPEFVDPLVGDVGSHLPHTPHVVMPLKPSFEELNLAVALHILLLVFSIGPASSLLSSESIMRNQIAVVVFILVVGLTALPGIVAEHAVLVVAEDDVAGGRRVQGPRAVVALTLIAVQAVAPLHIHLLLLLLLLLEVVLKSLILELRVEVLEGVAST